MKRVVLAAMALSMLATQPATAQYYGDPYRGGQSYFEEDDFDDRPRRRYRRDFEERDFAPRREFRSRRAQVGSICLTSRGNCDVGYPAPISSRCRCDIPGFGPKRGAIGY
jgi:hypothetical protein